MSPILTRLIVAVVIMALPPALGHTDQGGPGTPDYTCQTPPEWRIHDYVHGKSGFPLIVSDNNVEECGTTYGFFVAKKSGCGGIETHVGLGPGNLTWELLCHTDRPADFDGDAEFGLGGAVLVAESGDGVTSGSIACFGMLGHHSGTIVVQDVVFGSNVIFMVGADASLVPIPGEPDCGDGVIRPCAPSNSGLGAVVDATLDLLQTGNCNPNDHTVWCYYSCTAPFSPGADGAYAVWVYPTPNGVSGGPTGASHGHVFA